MKFIHGLIIAIGLLVAANLVMISADIESGVTLDYTKEPATLDMVKPDPAKASTSVIMDSDQMPDVSVTESEMPDVTIMDPDTVAVVESTTEVTVEIAVDSTGVGTHLIYTILYRHHLIL